MDHLAAAHETTKRRETGSGPPAGGSLRRWLPRRPPHEGPRSSSCPARPRPGAPSPGPAPSPSAPRNGMVVSQNAIASQVGVEVLMRRRQRGRRGGGDRLRARGRPPRGRQHRRGRLPRLPARRRGPRSSTTSARRRRPRPHPRCSCRTAQYSEERHHDSHLSVGVPGTVAGLRPSRGTSTDGCRGSSSSSPAIALARDGFVVSDGLARSLKQSPAAPAAPTPPRSPSSRGPACRTRRATCCSSRTSRRRSSASPRGVRRASTRGRRRVSSRRR